MVRHRPLASAPLAAVGRPGRDTDPNRTSTGIAELDAVLEGGFPAHRAVVVCGGAGTGKTTFGMQFLMDGVRLDEPGAYVSVDEKPRHLLEDAARLHPQVTAAIDIGTLTVLDASPFFTAMRTSRGSHRGVDVQDVAADLIKEVSRVGARRLVLDSLTSLVPPQLNAGEADTYVRALVQSLEDNAKCTTMVTCRSARVDPRDVSGDSARALAAGIIELRLSRRDGRLVRTMRIRKMRGTAIEPVDYPFTIEPSLGIAFVESVPAAMPALLGSASNL